MFPIFWLRLQHTVVKSLENSTFSGSGFHRWVLKATANQPSIHPYIHPSIHPSVHSHCFHTGVYVLQSRDHLWDLLLLQPTGANGGRSDRTEDFHVHERPSLQVKVAVVIRSRMLWRLLLMPLVLCVQRVRGSLHRPVNVGLLLHLGADRRGCSQ